MLKEDPLRLFALITIGGLAACDLNESPAEEAEEAVEAVRDGKSMDKVGNQVEDIGQAMTERRTKLEKRLAKVDAWFEERANELEASGEDADEQLEASMKDLGDRIEKLQTKLADQSQEIGDDVSREVDSLEAEIQEMSRDVD